MNFKAARQSERKVQERDLAKLRLARNVERNVDRLIVEPETEALGCEGTAESIGFLAGAELEGLAELPVSVEMLAHGEGDIAVGDAVAREQSEVVRESCDAREYAVFDSAEIGAAGVTGGRRIEQRAMQAEAEIAGVEGSALNARPRTFRGFRIRRE